MTPEQQYKHETGKYEEMMKQFSDEMKGNIAPESCYKCPDNKYECEYRCKSEFRGWLIQKLTSETTRADKAEAERDMLAKHIIGWCEAIYENGGGWDYWDDYYKKAWFDNTEINKIINRIKGK